MSADEQGELAQVLTTLIRRDPKVRAAVMRAMCRPGKRDKQVSAFEVRRQDGSVVTHLT